ncbi:hypothetical protein FXO38_13198 [Capsicum annuum]|nr:hypothetical protein FXO38_13198 [Capsicum annuum]
MKHCTYYSRVAGHDTESCLSLKDKIETLIKEGVIQLKRAPPNVNNNPLSNYENAHVNTITIDEECNLEGTIVSVINKEKVKTSTFIAPETTVQVQAPIEVERLKLPLVLTMVALEILKNGFVPSQGLGVNLDRILDPVKLSRQNRTFGLGYEPTLEEFSSANLKRKGDILLPKTISLLNQSFSKVFVAQVSEKYAEEDLVEGLKNLFIEKVECNAILEDCSKNLTIWDALEML